MFKIGDRVGVINADSMWYGESGTIIDIRYGGSNGQPLEIRIDLINSDTRVIWTHASWCTLLKPSLEQSIELENSKELYDWLSANG